MTAAGRILRAYKVRLVPTVEQRRALARACGSARAAYNWALAEWRCSYRAYRLAAKAPSRARGLLERWGSPLAADPRWLDPSSNRAPNAYEIHKRLNAVRKHSMPWLEQAPSHVVREAVLDVGKAYAHFFRRLKKHQAGDHSECSPRRTGNGCNLGEPRFRSRGGRRSAHLDEGKALAIRADAVRLQKIGWIRIHKRQCRYLPAADYDAKTKVWSGAKICGIGFSEHLGEWYASVRVDEPHKPTRKARIAEKRLGAEVGVRSLVVTSDGKRIGAMRDLERTTSAERRLTLWSRRMARRYRDGAKRQSAGWHEAKSHVQRIHAEIARARDELLHYAANRIVDSGAARIIMRKPGVRQMIARARKRDDDLRTRNALAPMISKVGWYELRRKVEYKQRWAGGEFVETPTDVATSRTCSVCGTVRDTDPGYPDFRCPSCGHRADRELNSAIVLRDFAPSSGGGKGGDRTDRRKTGRKAGTTAERTAIPAATGQPVTSGADGAGESLGVHGSGNGATPQGADTDRVISDPTRPGGEPSACPRSAANEHRGDARINAEGNPALASPPDGPVGDCSQVESQRSDNAGTPS